MDDNQKKYESERLEAQKRIDALSENLKKEILADKNVQLISDICRDYSIPEEKVKRVALLVGEVFLGYIKPEEVSSELNTYFDIDLQKSNFIEIELKQKLFNPLKVDLEKIYNPPEISTEETEKSEEEFAPTIIKPETEAPSASSGQAPSTSSGQAPSTSSGQAPVITVGTAAPISIANVPIQTAPIVEKQPRAGNQESPQKISPLTIGSIPAQPIKTETPLPAGIPKNEPTPLVIQTKVEAVKRAMSQFPKETPSINLKVNESILEKPAIKPISIRLETEQPRDTGIRFKMPVMANQQPKIGIKPVPEKSFDKAPGLREKLPPLPRLRPDKSDGQVGRADQQKTTDKKEPIISTQPKIEIKSLVQKKPIVSQTISQPAISQIKSTSEQKPIFEFKLSQEQTPKVVHYSNFKTPLTSAGAPKKTEPKKEDLINLSTFTKVSGNTVDLRSTTNNQRPTTNDKAKDGKI